MHYFGKYFVHFKKHLVCYQSKIFCISENIWCNSGNILCIIKERFHVFEKIFDPFFEEKFCAFFREQFCALQKRFCVFQQNFVYFGKHILHLSATVNNAWIQFFRNVYKVIQRRDSNQKCISLFYSKLESTDKIWLINMRLLHLQINFDSIRQQLSRGVLWKSCSENYQKIYGKTPVVESYFKVSDLTKIGLHREYFPGSFPEKLQIISSTGKLWTATSEHKLFILLVKINRNELKYFLNSRWKH